MSSVHGLKTFHDNHAHVHISLSAVGKTRWFTRAELSPRGTGYALVPASICKLSHHFIQHCSFFFTSFIDPTFPQNKKTFIYPSGFWRSKFSIISNPSFIYSLIITFPSFSSAISPRFLSRICWQVWWGSRGCLGVGLWFVPSSSLSNLKKKTLIIYLL